MYATPVKKDSKRDPTLEGYPHDLDSDAGVHSTTSAE